MKFLNKVWRFCVKTGCCLFLLLIMFIGAVSLVAITQKGKINYGNRCNCSLNENVISYLNQKEIIAYDYDLQCNTLYLDLVLEENATKETAKSILIRLSSYYKTIEYNVDTQITLKGNNYLILASLVNQEITLTTTNI